MVGASTACGRRNLCRRQKQRTNLIQVRIPRTRNRSLGEQSSELGLRTFPRRPRSAPSDDGRVFRYVIRTTLYLAEHGQPKTEKAISQGRSPFASSLHIISSDQG